MWSVTVYGTPAPKGSMKCVGRNGSHQLVEQDRLHVGKPWRALVKMAGEQIRAKAGDELQTGSLSVEATVTIERPATVKPAARPWPSKQSRGHADVDKLARMLLDGLTDSKVWFDDAQVCELTVRKAYPDTPDCPDVLDRPGAIIRIWRTT